jgi:hypothetical protein
MEVFPLFRTFDKRQLNLSPEQGFEHLICGPAASRDSDLRILPPKSGYERITISNLETYFSLRWLLTGNRV